MTAEIHRRQHDRVEARLDAVAGMQAQSQRLLDLIAGKLGITHEEYEAAFRRDAEPVTEVDPTELKPGDVVVKLGDHDISGCHCDVRVTVRRQKETPGPSREELTGKLVARRAWRLRNLIREADALSEPVPEGHWRWADKESDGYRTKSPERLAADRERYKAKAAELRRELAVLTGEEA